jgi:hypothetical protein
MPSSTAYGTTFKATDRFGCYPDRVYTAKALPNATNEFSDVFSFAKVEGRVELEITANTNIVIADGATLKFEAFWDKSATGSFTNSRVISAYAPVGAAQTIVAGTVVALITPESDIEQFVKIKTTASANQSAHKIDGQLYMR